ncbi:multiple sugar transport system permease protein [Thermanaeromonas toyohensis ToBE]|uniref:Multiple sugar transport system permease protein n=1 Tax=Thermanaeromonas toyohensis ToBE TaxID=698762 RepID=A0A1W1VVH8_9FIRM|nr:sugar ABC transporter permease [Thermanaeromonas toyohensis]SMB97385.1 multiple sugar transport system permease protein [Thermanaeromonas toyohensis ToBE]
MKKELFLRLIGRHEEKLAGISLVLPNLMGFGVFVFFACGMSLWLSFHDWDMLTPARFVGFKNYIAIIEGDPHFRKVLYNTLYIALIYIPFTLITSLILAVFLNQKLRWIAIFRAAYYMPAVTATVAISVVWMFLFNPEYGPINLVLGSLGLPKPGWLFSVEWAKPAVAIVRTWQSAGYYMLMFLAGLQAIPHELYEAASIDGASGWVKFWRITLPMLSPTTFLVLVLLVIDGLNVFEAVYVMTRGGPAGSTETWLYYIYSKAFEGFKMGYATALAWLLFVALFLLTIFQFWLQRKWVYHE